MNRLGLPSGISINRKAAGGQILALGSFHNSSSGGTGSLVERVVRGGEVRRRQWGESKTKGL